MEALKNEIQKILEKHQVDETTNTGTTGEKIIYWQSFSDIQNDIANLIQTVFDPENQPNQLGIENPFKVFCMPDEVIDEETHEQYLKDIGVRK